MSLDLSCQELVELLSDYLDGALASDVADTIEGHLADCAACLVAWEHLRTTVVLLHSTEVETLDPGVRSV